MKTIKDINIQNKKVIIRCDFNVPIKNGVITDDNRIKESLKTITYALEQNSKIILLSHLGRVKDEESKKSKTLQPVALRLSELLKKEINFINETRGTKLENAVNNLKSGEIILVENTRVEDFPEKLESKNNPELANYWASLGEIFINDAFGTAHRAHASNVGIASHLESGIGFLIEKELEAMKLLENPKRPFTVILGGSKVSDKIGLIENLVKTADYILIGGGMANTFIKAKGYEMGKSLLDLESLDFCRKILSEYSEKLIIPVDFKGSIEVSNESTVQNCNYNEITEDFIALDVGNKTVELFNEFLTKSETIVWNGPVGMFELSNYAGGSKEIATHLKNIKKITIIGGGDTAAAVIGFGLKEAFTHISTGGGATIEMLEGKVLPGIEVIK